METIELRAGEAIARIAPAIGANCYSFAVAGREQLEPPPSLAELAARPSGWGCPILFPFPGQLEPGWLELLGRRVQIEANSPNGRHGHGFAPRRPWRVIERSADACACRLEGGGDDAYPWRFRLTTRFRVTPGMLGIGVVVENLDHVGMPFGLGLHPYTAIAPDALLEIPAHASWPHEGGIPTGTPTPVAGPWRWRELAEGASTLLTDLPLEDLEARAGAVSLRWPGDRFGEVTLYRPPGRPSVCVEPWTSVSNAAAQIAPGATHGLVVIPPMQPWRAWLEIAPA